MQINKILIDSILAEKKRRRDMWKNIPFTVRQSIVARIDCMPCTDRKLIVCLAFQYGLSTEEIRQYMEITGAQSRNHRAYSKRRVQQIIAEEVPEYNAYQVHGKHPERAGHYKFLWNSSKPEKCQLCGASGNIEWHHMIPVCKGGTEDKRNMIAICHDCHAIITAYQRELFPQDFIAHSG